MRKLIFLGLFLLLAGDAWAANRYCKIAGGNYSATTTWSATSSAGVDNASVPSSSDAVIFDASSATTGSLVIDVDSNCASFTAQAGATGTLSQGAFALTSVGSITFVSTMTYTVTNTAFGTGGRLIMNGSGTFTSGTKLIQTLRNSAGTLTLGDTVNFNSNKNTSVVLNNAGINLNGFMISGNSAVNRVLIYSLTLGTARNITVSGGTFANADFRDIALNTPTDLSAITGGSGDCGGNAGITFTTADTMTWKDASGGNWSDVGNWTKTAAAADRVPLPQDTVNLGVAFSASQTVTADMPRLGKNISFSGATGSPAFTLSNAVTTYGSLDFTGMGTFGGAYTWSVESVERTSIKTVTSSGKTFTGSFVSATVGATLLLDDNLITSNAFMVTDGTLNANNKNVMSLYFYDNASARSKTISMGSGTWTSTNNSGDCWNFTAGGTLISSPNSSTIELNSASASSKTFKGGNLTYYNLTTPSGTGGVTISGSNSFNSIQAASGGKITLTASTTQTITGSMATGFGNGTNVLTLLSSSAGTAATLDYDGTGLINADYLSITDTNVTPASTWYYGANSTYVSGTGWNSGVGSTGRNLLISDVTPMGEGHIGAY